MLWDSVPGGLIQMKMLLFTQQTSKLLKLALFFLKFQVLPVVVIKEVKSNTCRRGHGRLKSPLTHAAPAFSLCPDAAPQLQNVNFLCLLINIHINSVCRSSTCLFECTDPFPLPSVPIMNPHVITRFIIAYHLLRVCFFSCCCCF